MPTPRSDTPAEARPRRGEDWRLLRRVLAGYHRRLIALGVSNFVGGFLEAAFLVAVTRIGLAIADGESRLDVGFDQDVSTGVALAGAAGLVVVRIMTALATVRLATSLREDVTLQLRRRMAEAFLHASWATQQAERSGRLQQFLNKYVSSAVGIVDAATTALGAGLTLFALLLTAVVVDPVAWLVVLAALALLGGVIAPLRRRVRARSASAERAGMEFSTSVSELGELGLEMQTFGVRGQFAERIDALAVAEARAKRRLGFLKGVVAPVYTSLAFLALLGALSAVEIVGVGDLASLGAVMLIMLRSLSYGQNVQNALTSLVASAPVLTVYYDTAATFEADPAPGGAEPVERVGELMLDGVGFEYLPGQPVLNGVTMRLVPGEIVGVIGPSGAGKSTLVQLVLGLRNPTTGAVLADGRDLRVLLRDDLAQLIAFVPQTPHLIDASVSENIALFRPGLTSDDIERAARRAYLHDEIMAMPDRYASSVGPRGGRLSGGQQQRLCIARALAGKPEVLILDEPTSSLDPRSESLICETLADLRGESTVIVIAHRLTTLSMADRIAVIQDGKLAAFDTAASLEADGGFYREALTLSGIQ